MNDKNEQELRETIAKEIVAAYHPQEWDATNLWGRALEFAAKLVRRENILESDQDPVSIEPFESNILFEGVTTNAGRELIKYMNNNYGSAIWGKVALSVKEIEMEIKNERL